MIVRTGEEIATDLKDERHTAKTFNEDCKKKYVEVNNIVKYIKGARGFNHSCQAMDNLEKLITIPALTKR